MTRTAKSNHFPQKSKKAFLTTSYKDFKFNLAKHSPNQLHHSSHKFWHAQLHSFLTFLSRPFFPCLIFNNCLPFFWHFNIWHSWWQCLIPQPHKTLFLSASSFCPITFDKRSCWQFLNLSFARFSCLIFIIVCHFFDISTATSGTVDDNVWLSSLAKHSSYQLHHSSHNFWHLTEKSKKALFTTFSGLFRTSASQSTLLIDFIIPPIIFDKRSCWQFLTPSPRFNLDLALIAPIQHEGAAHTWRFSQI